MKDEHINKEIFENLEHSTKLTEKQQRFCELFIKYGNATQAYREVYDVSNFKESSISQEAHNILKNPKISCKIIHLQTELSKEWKTDMNWIFTEYSSIYHIAKSKNRPNVALQALDSIAKHLGVKNQPETHQILKALLVVPENDLLSAAKLQEKTQESDIESEEKSDV